MQANNKLAVAMARRDIDQEKDIILFIGRSILVLRSATAAVLEFSVESSGGGIYLTAIAYGILTIHGRAERRVLIDDDPSAI